MSHSPTGRGRRLLGSGRRGWGARISGSGGLCGWARGSASSGEGGRRGQGRTLSRGGAKAGGRSARSACPRCSEFGAGASSRGRDSSGLAHARRLAAPAAAPTVRASAATSLRARPKAGSCGWRNAVQTPAFSSARPAARSAPHRCGGGRGARRPGSAGRAAAAASSLHPRPPS